MGALAAVTGVAFLFALTFFRKGGFSERDSYVVHAFFSDATGLTWKTRVQIAGIQIGEVADIALVGAKARLDLRVKNGIEVHSDACLTKTFPSALLPDAIIEIQPGSAEKPLLSSIPEDQRVITCVREATSVQQLLDSMSKIAADVELVTGDLARTVTGQKGLREIVENLASATKRIDETIARNEESVAQLIANARDFAGDLREISQRDKGKLGRIATNIEELTARLNVIASSLQEIIDPGAAGRGRGGRVPAPRGSAPLPPPPEGGKTITAAIPPGTPEEPSGPAGSEPPAGSGPSTAETPPERAAVVEQARGVKQAVEKLTQTLEKLDNVVAKVSEGKSVAGRLLVDERLGRKVGTAAEDLADQLDRVFKLQIQIQLRSEWLLNQTGAKAYFGARIVPRPDKYYLLEVVSDPRGLDDRSSETITTSRGGVETTTVSTRTLHQENKLTFSAQFAKRYGPITFRIGVIESSGGAGADLHLFHDALQLSMSVYQFSRPYQDIFPRAKVYVNYYFLQHLFVTAGTDDFLNRWRSGRFPGGPKFTLGNDVFFGGGLFFTDDDLKTLIGAGGGSAVPRGGG